MTEPALMMAAKAPLVANLLLLHGAGAPVQSAFFQQLQPALANVGLGSLAFNLAYMEQVRQGHKRPPPKLSLLLDELTEKAPPLLDQATGPWFLAGKSMGGRLMTQLLSQPQRYANWPVKPKGAVVFGYPFCPDAARKAGGSKLEKQLHTRTEFWPLLAKPVLVLQGERDSFGSASEIQQHIVSHAPSASLQVQAIAQANHDFVRAKSMHDDVFKELADACLAFVTRVLAKGS